jgi:hypothetical protein
MNPLEDTNKMDGAEFHAYVSKYAERIEQTSGRWMWIAMYACAVGAIVGYFIGHWASR